MYLTVQNRNILKNNLFPQYLNAHTFHVVDIGHTFIKKRKSKLFSTLQASSNRLNLLYRLFHLIIILI
jgi:hypothetical protein